MESSVRSWLRRGAGSEVMVVVMAGLVERITSWVMLDGMRHGVREMYLCYLKIT